MTKLAPPLRVDCPRDRFKRPVIDGVTYQRVTTLAGMIDDTYALTNWKMRQVAKGVAWRDDIRIAVATTKDDDQDGKRELDALCERAMDAAGGNAGSAMGTAFHRVTQIAQAHPDVDPASYCPPELRGELAAYRALIAHGGLSMPVEYQERTGICPELGVAGTWDDLAAGGLSCGCGRFHVVDKKSGQREFEYGQGKVSAQLSIYARFRSLWLAIGGGYEQPPEICPEVGYVISVPIGRPDDAVIYPVDLVKGWERAKLAVDIREARSVKRGLFGEALTLPGARVVHGITETVVKPARKPRRTKAQIEADKAEAAANAAAAAPVSEANFPTSFAAYVGTASNDDEADAAVSERRANEPTPDTGQPFLMNGELRPGPADPIDTALDALDVAVVDAEEKAAAAVALLQDKLGAEVVRPSKEQLEAERVAALAGLRNGTTAQSELVAEVNASRKLEAKVEELARDERRELEGAILSATGAADLETAYTLWSAHWTPEHDHMAVRRLISLMDGSAEALGALQRTYQAVWTDDLTREGVRRYISLTGTREGLDRIWEQYQTVWTDDLTAAGEARLRELARL